MPGGLRVRDYVTKDDAGYHLTLRDTWTEAYRSAYVTAEIWIGFDEVWVQPVYVPITGFADGDPRRSSSTRPRGAWSPIFSVGADSAFYSPFWQVFYFQVPDGTDPDALTSARQVIDSGLPLIEGPARTMSLVPGAVGPAADGGGLGSGDRRARRRSAPGYLDGKPISFLDFGTDTFSWNEDLVVDETPLFVLVYRDDDGNLRAHERAHRRGHGAALREPPAQGRERRPALRRVLASLHGRGAGDGAHLRAARRSSRPRARTIPRRSSAASYGPNVIDAGTDDVGRGWGAWP